MIYSNFSFPLLIVALLLAIFPVSYNFPQASEASSFSKAMAVSSIEPESGPAPPPCFKSIPKPMPDPIPPPTCNPNPEYVVVPQYVPVSGSFFANAPEVTLFTNVLLDIIYKTDILRKALDVSQTTTKQYADYHKQFIEDRLVDLGISNASFLADWIYMSMMKNFGCRGCPRLTLAIVARLHANFVAHCLFVAKILTIDNAEYLGSTYAQSFADAAYKYLNSDPTSKFVALTEGTANFVFSVVQNMKEMAPIFAVYCGNEYHVAAMNYRWW